MKSLKHNNSPGYLWLLILAIHKRTKKQTTSVSQKSNNLWQNTHWPLSRLQPQLTFVYDTWKKNSLLKQPKMLITVKNPKQHLAQACWETETNSHIFFVGKKNKVTEVIVEQVKTNYKEWKQWQTSDTQIATLCICTTKALTQLRKEKGHYFLNNFFLGVWSKEVYSQHQFNTGRNLSLHAEYVYFLLLLTLIFNSCFKFYKQKILVL